MRRCAKRVAAVLAVLVVLSSACTNSDPDPATASDRAAAPVAFDAITSLASPNGQLRIELGLDEIGRPRYRVIDIINGRDVVVVGDSTLGIETSLTSLATAPEMSALGPAEQITDSFSLPHGKARSASIEAMTQSVQAGELTIDLWASDTGVAFRYRLDGRSDPYRIEWERTSFSIDPDARAWLQPHDAPGIVTPAYEVMRPRSTAAASPRPSSFGWTFPALFATENHWLLITETALGDGAAGSHLSPVVEEGEYLIDLPHRGEGNGVGDPRPVVGADGWASPWRLIVASPDVGDIVESHHVRHLSPGPSADDDFAWVQPGTVSWSWWSDFSSSRSADKIKPFIDMASELGWPYALVDANWNVDQMEFGEDGLADLADYAAARNVELFVWYNSGGPNNAVTEAPRDRMATSQARRAEFEFLSELGVAGVKVDFFHSDKPETIQLYRDILRDAADFELMVNFHGSTTPRGWQREFPNLMTMEAVRGGEHYAINAAAYTRVAPRQNTVLPFTRNVTGPMDYTPTVLGDQFARRTTNAHELAIAVLFESPLQHLVDTPDVYLSQPEVVRGLLSELPTAWDEIHFIDGEPESHVAIARRDGDDWWIGAISALTEPVLVTVDLTELGVAPGASVRMVCDNLDDPDLYEIRVTDAADQLRLDLARLGGCLVAIT